MSGPNQYDFASTAVDDFLAGLKALPVQPVGSDTRLLPLTQASQYARTTVANGVQMVRNGAVRIAGIDEGAVGIARFLVSASAMTRAARQEKVPGLTMMAAAPLL